MDPNRLQHKIRIEPKDVDPSKLTGPRAKTKYQREKEALELRARQDEEAAARAYSDFVDSFEANGGDAPAAAGQKKQHKGFVKAGGSAAYNPLLEKQEALRMPAPSRASRPAFQREESPPQESAGRRKRKMDTFLEELKKDQADRESRLAQKAGSSNMSVSALAAAETGGEYNDPTTTNVHIHPLPAGISEQDLGDLLAKYGDVGTVKIMWPREEAFAGGPKQTKTAGMGGFVAMMERRPAEKAYKDLDGFEWHGALLRTTWGKAVPLPYKALYPASQPEALTSRRSRSPSPRGRRSDPLPPTSKRYRRDYSSSRSPSPKTDRAPRVWPELATREEERFLEDTSDKIRSRGSKYEQVLRENERSNPRFAFLFEEALPSFHFFKMLQDRNYKWEQPLEFDDAGSMTIDSSATESESEETKPRPKAKAKGPFNKTVRRKMEALLRGLTMTRADIGRAMAHAMENAEWSDEISDMIVMSIMLPTTPNQLKIARLYLLSDILANSSNALPGAWKYRSAFEEKLLHVFDHFNLVIQSFHGRMKAEAFRRQIVNVLNHWEALLVFTPSVLAEYTKRLMTGGQAAEDLEGAPMEDADMVEAAPKPVKAGFRNIKAPRPEGEELDGAPMEEDLDGEMI